LPIRGGDKTRPSKLIRSRSCVLSMGQLWVVLSSTSYESFALVMYATCSNISTRPVSNSWRSRLRTPQQVSHAALRAGLILCQKVRFLGMKKVSPWNWWTARRSNIHFSAIPHKAGVLIIILRANTPSRSVLRPLRDALNYLPLGFPAGGNFEACNELF
jgi:hypothetical protein